MDQIQISSYGTSPDEYGTYLYDNEDCDIENIYIGGLDGFGRGERGRDGRHSLTRNSEKSILPDLERLPLSDFIKHKAEEIYQRINPGTRRGKKRKKLVFCCIYLAYMAYEQPRDPNEVAKLVGIKPNEATKAFSMLSDITTDYSIPNYFCTPFVYIPQYHQRLNLDVSCLEDIKAFAEMIMEMDRNLYDDYPHIVAVGIILYYMSIHGATVNMKEAARIVGKSDMTITKMVKKISDVHNGA